MRIHQLHHSSMKSVWNIFKKQTWNSVLFRAYVKTESKISQPRFIRPVPHWQLPLKFPYFYKLFIVHGHKLKHKEFCLSIIVFNYNYYFSPHCEGGWMQEQFAQRGCGVFVLQDIQKSSGHSPGQPALEGGTGLHDLQGHLPPSIILWYITKPSTVLKVRAAWFCELQNDVDGNQRPGSGGNPETHFESTFLSEHLCMWSKTTSGYQLSMLHVHSWGQLSQVSFTEQGCDLIAHTSFTPSNYKRYGKNYL